MENQEKMRLSSVLSEGYGIIPKKVMKDKDLSIEAKAIYSFLCSYTGKGDTAFPSRDLVTGSLGISKERYYKHRKALIEKGYVSVSKERSKAGAFTRNIYTVHFDVPRPSFPDMEKPYTDKPYTDTTDTKKNSSKNNIFNNNKEILDTFEKWWSLYQKKGVKSKAVPSFAKAVSNHDYEVIEKGTIAYLKSVNNKQYLAHASTFLNQERFLDVHDYVANNIYEGSGITEEETSSGHDYLDGM